MEFGVMHLFDNIQGKSEKEIIDEAVEQFTYAEELGFDSIWFAEHHFSNYGTVGNPLLMAAAVAAKTTKIKIGAAVMILPFYNPIRLAEDVALVDIISNGRFELGVGRGYQPAEFKAFNIDQSTAQARSDEAIDILLQAWNEGEVNYNGKYFQYEGLQVYPKPFQKSSVPIHYAAVSTSTFEKMGKLGRSILTSPNFTPIPLIANNFQSYRNALQSAGYNPSHYKFPIMQQVHVQESSEAAKKTSLQSSKTYHDLLTKLLPGAEGSEVPEDYKFYAKVYENSKKLSIDQLEKHGGNFGSPDEIIERLKVMEKECGLNQYIGLFNFGGMGHKKTMDSMELFAKKVMPAFQKSETLVAR